MSDHDAPRVVFVEDDPSFRKIMSRELERMGFRVRAFGSAEGVRAHVEAEPPHAVVLDLNLPDANGLELLAELLAVDGALQVLVLTGHGSVADAVQAMRVGAFDFLTKPVSLDVLEQALRKGVATAELIAENRWLRRVAAAGRAGEAWLASPASRRLEAQIERLGRADKSVLVLGESGVGKELVARRLHAESPRRERPFVAVNCGAIPRQLVESELFGHRRGAFTGADSKRIGLFEAADTGTLFLDEIGELPLEVQPALLRAIQFGEIRPVGSEVSAHVDVRIVAATNRDLAAMVQAGEFREDLFYRVAILELRVPPLRERRDDIPPLARHFLAKEASRERRALGLTAAAEAWLVARDWPGNVRELENAMVRAAVLARGPEIDEPELLQILDASTRARSPDGLPTLRLRDLEQLAIAEALRRHDGNKRRAADELGVALKTLYNKLNRPAGE